MSNDLIEKRNERTKQRKEKKRKMDSLIGLAINPEGKESISLSASVATITDTNQTVRLLDEGYCDNGFVLMKGAIEKYLNGQNEHVTGWEMVNGAWQRTEVLNLTDDFVGTVNLGHQDFATHPFILGEFKKSDFSIEDIEDDRKALNVDVRLDEDSMYVKELRRQPYDIGVSAEFYYHIDWDATMQLYESYNMWMPAIDEIFIFAYGLVGECGNVNSSGLELKGDSMKNAENIMENVVDETTEDTEMELGIEEVEIPTTDEQDETPVEENAADETVEDTTDKDDTEEAADGDEAETDETEDGDEGEGDEAEEETLALINGLKDQIQTLSDRIDTLEQANASLKKTNRKLSSKYQKELEKKEKFKESIKGLSVELLPEEEKIEKEKAEQKKVTENNKAYYHGDGIGEI